MESSVPHSPRHESGFTLVEVLIAGVVLSVGLVGLAGMYGQGLMTVMTAQEDTIARQKAREAMESVLTGRNTANLTYAQIENISKGGVFKDGFTPLTTPGPDGIVNTLDDGPVETIIMPGPDGILGTSDDVVVPLNGYQRQILITDVTSILKQVQVTILYTTTRGQTRSVTLNCYVSPYI
jgi:type II secretory pathway pseudopilin PulG